MIVLLEELIMQILLWELKLIEEIFRLFTSVRNFEEYVIDGKQKNLIDYFLNNSLLENIFQSILLVSVLLITIMMIVTIIKNFITNNKTIKKIVGDGFITIVSIFIMSAIFLLVIKISNLFLSLFIDIFEIDFSVNISKVLFQSTVGEWFSGYSVNEINFETITTNKLMGSYIMEEGIFPLRWACNGMINPNSYSYVLAFVSVNIVLFSLIFVAIRLLKRVYDLLLIYLSMPLFASSIVMDGGLRFKKWVLLWVKKVLIIFVFVMSFNILGMLLPVLLNIKLFNMPKELESIYRCLIIVSGFLFLAKTTNISQNILDDSHKETVKNNILIEKDNYITDNHPHRYINEIKRREKNASYT